MLLDLSDFVVVTLPDLIHYEYVITTDMKTTKIRPKLNWNYS